MKYLIILGIIAILLAGVTAFTVIAQQGVIELEKADAMDLLNAQNVVRVAQSNRNRILNQILAKYGATLETHEVNVLAGQLIPLVQESLETVEAN